MPNKTEEYLALACKTADSFSRQWEHWAEFLITAARLYKHSYGAVSLPGVRPQCSAGLGCWMSSRKYETGVQKTTLLITIC